MPGKNGGHSLDKARALFDARGDHCAICGGPIMYRAGRIRNPKTGKLARHPLSLDVDHIVPTCQGGSDDLSNLQATHHQCNLRAGAKSKRPRCETAQKEALKRGQTRTSRNWLGVDG